MAQFVTISQSEMAELLGRNGFVKIEVPGVFEEVWSLRVDRNLCVRVYTTIEGTRSRSNGTDSIKVCLVSRTPDDIVRGVGSTKRVHRVVGWATNLQKRIDRWKEELLGPICSCGCYMVAKTSRRGHFWGCSNYPKCKNIQN